MGWQVEGREKMGRGKSWQEALRQPAQLLENEIMPPISNAWIQRKKEGRGRSGESGCRKGTVQAQEGTGE